MSWTLVHCVASQPRLEQTPCSHGCAASLMRVNYKREIHLEIKKAFALRHGRNGQRAVFDM